MIKRTPGEILARGLKLEQEGVDREAVDNEVRESGKTIEDFFHSHGVSGFSCVITSKGREVYRSDDSGGEN